MERWSLGDGRKELNKDNPATDYEQWTYDNDYNVTAVRTSKHASLFPFLAPLFSDPRFAVLEDKLMHSAILLPVEAQP